MSESRNTTAWPGGLVWAVPRAAGGNAAELIVTMDTLVVDSIWVHEDHRRQGLATRLFREARSAYPEIQHDEDNLSADAKEWVETL